ncbi:MAG: type I restriction endonuclease subunit R [Synechococcales cyanobacterium RU_4_20]|nr:type I restriction endonuclease subunit R [Synechococcales cyanobacterium RU_4_20]
MAKVVAVTEAIRSLADVESRFGLSRSLDPEFFPEWHNDLPSLSQAQQSAVEVMWNRLDYQRSQGDLLEGAVTLLAASPLLKIAGFYDPPFRLKAEAAVELTVDDGEEVLRGRIDVLIIHNGLWVLVLGSKETTISARSALPQALAYLMAAPASAIPIFGMLTNGDDVLFLKIMRGGVRQYALSRVFSLYAVPEDGAEAICVLKNLGGRTGRA